MPLDAAHGGEFHMPADKPGIVMRQQLLELLVAHGEREARRGDALAGEPGARLRGVAGE